MENKHYFYVLLCNDNSFYGGYTTDTQRRLSEHNKGVGAKYTQAPSRRPVKMIYIEEFDSRSKATKAEYAFKKLTRAKKKLFLSNQRQK